jgi:hypothetical protein
METKGAQGLLVFGGAALAVLMIIMVLAIS